MTFPIKKIVIHCSATRNGRSLAAHGKTAAQVIDGWHKQRGFRRLEQNRKAFNAHLAHIGYHYVIDVTGKVESGRREGEMGAHVKGHNMYSIGICLVGGIRSDGKNYGEYTVAQWQTLHKVLRNLENKYPNALICGHRDLSPDLNGDGTITPNEWVKDCPCFDVRSYLEAEQIVNNRHLFKE